MNALAELLPSSTGPTTTVNSARFTSPTFSSVSVSPYRGAVVNQNLADLLEEASHSLDNAYQKYFQTYLFDWSKTRSENIFTVPLVEVTFGDPDGVFDASDEPPTVFDFFWQSTRDSSSARQALNESKLETSLDKVLGLRGFDKIAADTDALGAWTIDFTRDNDRVTAAISSTVIQIMSYSRGAFEERRFPRTSPWAEIEQFIVSDLVP